MYIYINLNVFFETIRKSESIEKKIVELHSLEYGYIIFGSFRRKFYTPIIIET